MGVDQEEARRELARHGSFDRWRKEWVQREPPWRPRPAQPTPPPRMVADANAPPPAGRAGSGATSADADDGGGGGGGGGGGLFGSINSMLSFRSDAGADDAEGCTDGRSSPCTPASASSEQPPPVPEMPMFVSLFGFGGGGGYDIGCGFGGDSAAGVPATPPPQRMMEVRRAHARRTGRSRVAV